MTKRTVIYWISSLGLVSLIAILYLAYSVIDQAVTIDHYGSEISYQSKTINLLASLVVECPRDGAVEDVFRTLRGKYPDEVVKLRGDTIEIGAVTLVFRDSMLVRVSPF